MNIRAILEYALQREIEGKRFFEENTTRLKNAAAVSAFKVIAAEEEKHIQIIRARIAQLDSGESPGHDAVELPASDFFATRAKSEEISQTVDEAMVADLPVLRMAYLIERDFAEFYTQAAEKTASDEQLKDAEQSKAMLEALARWEASHEKLFKELHDRAFEQYARMPWGG